MFTYISVITLVMVDVLKTPYRFIFKTHGISF